MNISMKRFFLMLVIGSFSTTTVLPSEFRAKKHAKQQHKLNLRGVNKPTTQPKHRAQEDLNSLDFLKTRNGSYYRTWDAATMEPSPALQVEQPVILRTIKRAVIVQTIEQVIPQIIEQPMVLQNIEQPAIPQIIEQPMVLQTMERPVPLQTMEQPGCLTRTSFDQMMMQQVVPNIDQSVFHQIAPSTPTIEPKATPKPRQYAPMITSLLREKATSRQQKKSYKSTPIITPLPVKKTTSQQRNKPRQSALMIDLSNDND